MEHHLRNAAGEEHLDGRMVARPVGQCVDESRHAAADLGPVAGGRAAAGLRRGRSPECAGADSSIRRTPRAMTIAFRSDASVRMSRTRMPRSSQSHQRASRPPRHIEPDRLPRRRRAPSAASDKPERLADDLRRRRRAEKLTAAAGRRARAAPQLRRLLQRDRRRARSARRSSARLPASSPSTRQQRHAAGHEHARQIVACRPAPSSSPAAPCRTSRCQAPRARRQRAHQPAEDRRRVVAIRQAVEHAGVPCVRPSHGSVHEPANGTRPRA